MDSLYYIGIIHLFAAACLSVGLMNGEYMLNGEYIAGYVIICSLSASLGVLYFYLASQFDGSQNEEYGVKNFTSFMQLVRWLTLSWLFVPAIGLLILSAYFRFIDPETDSKLLDFLMYIWYLSIAVSLLSTIILFLRFKSFRKAENIALRLRYNMPLA